jgi:RNA polymerase sigma-70 factor (ECF subfamily)
LDLESIITGCKQQNREAQKTLYNVFKKPLFHSCLKYSSSIEEAEDILHDAFIDIFTSISSFKNTGSFEGWMKRIVINKAVTKFKLKPKTQEIEKMKLAPVEEEETIINDNLLDDILNSIQELPNQYQLVFCLYELDDYSHREIATLLSISESTSKSNLHRAKELLKIKLAEKNSTKKVSNGI